MESKSILERARRFIYGNARLLDRKRYEYHFEGGSREEVIEALRAYQNADGGFGNTLEPDIRCPYSQPVPTEMALAIMDEVGLFDSRILEGINRYLRSVTLPQGGVPLVMRNASEYPHAPWWAADEDRQPSINPTGGIVGLLYKQQALPDIVREEHFVRSVQYVWSFVEREKPDGFHDGVHWISFLQHTPERERAQAIWPAVDEWLRSPGTIERDPDAAGYVHKVLDWAPSKDSYARRIIAGELVEQHVQALIAQQREDGGWAISFPAASPAGELEWRGSLTVDRLKTLRSYGAL
ncbi:prenyltransferase/squalene oxidase repeat-containing protein [Paenibacillus ginsengarvi]|uniref:Squalene cyclase C-terminal domain-containing protein n=1 Tax=Paenibacillus ginsengarvi TaxID=400777 RepID=A0A3B0CDL5_9BACL|nr:prenyltransferase/squalene oxidase repeat-containing protein [Paenibacillus ginsengarvi]RKN83933.1 hypothetical protein D7M11_15230 [Paenibacillus ginsengarvi]